MSYSSKMPTPDRIRVLAADSTAMNTQLLVEGLGRNAQFEMIEAPLAETEILPLVRNEQPQVALISATPGQNGVNAFDLIRRIRAQAPSPRVVVMLDHSEAGAVVEAFRAGAHGVFCRTEPFPLLARCIECVHSGQVWASSSQLQFVIEALSQSGESTDFRPLSDSPLSPREADVVRCLTEGLSNREIAAKLKLSEHTIKNYLFRIFDKLGFSSRLEVVLYAMGNGDLRAVPPNTHKSHVGTSRKAAGPIPISVRKTAT
jgi:DNA-binding NarL/FixJ family response regulator